MNYNLLLDVATELGYQLALGGAETFRIEESMSRVMAAYEIPAEVFAIPNCLHISTQTGDGQPITRMRRIGQHGNDLDAVEKYSNLSRKICSQRPDPETAMAWLQEIKKTRKHYSFGLYLLGCFLVGSGFSVLFGANALDSLCSGLCAILTGLMVRFLDNQKTNPFFKTIIASFGMALLAYFTGFIGLAHNTDTVIIGAIMLLVPGLLFTNAMRDIIYGDTNSGINRIVQVFLIAAAIGLGTGSAWSFAGFLRTMPPASAITQHPLWIEALNCLVCCSGFIAVFNIHGKGNWLCVLGGAISWIVYRLIQQWTRDDILALFCAGMVASLYAEIMARIRKYPAISYLVVSAIPLFPGAGIYYSVQHVVKGDMVNFANQGTQTAAYAGAIAVGVLIASTLVRLFTSRRKLAKSGQ